MSAEYVTAVFTREAPCTKIEIWNCFYHTNQFVDRKVIEARTLIGLNVPKFLLREGYVEVRTSMGADWYVLTPAGREWLTAGTVRYLELHPERAGECNSLPRNAGIAPTKKAALRPSATPPAPTRAVRRRR